MMKKAFLSSMPIAADAGLLVIRLVAGGAMLTHGFPKLQKVLDGNFQFGDPIGLGPEVSLLLAVFAEFICSLLVIIGLTTRLALIPLIITMCVAFFIVHGADAFGDKELPFFYLGAYIGLFLTGPGKLSADHTVFRR